MPHSDFMWGNCDSSLTWTSFRSKELSIKHTSVCKTSQHCYPVYMKGRWGKLTSQWVLLHKNRRGLFPGFLKFMMEVRHPSLCQGILLTTRWKREEWQIRSPLQQNWRKLESCWQKKWYFPRQGYKKRHSGVLGISWQLGFMGGRGKSVFILQLFAA